jgi:protein-tyrosine phosphatase
MIRVLFVCHGNICRSPLAQGIFDKLIKEQGLDKKISSDSAGTHNDHSGDDPDPRSVQVAKDNGIKLDHKARQIKLKDYEDFDYIIPMDIMNQTNILQKKSQTISPRAQIIMMRKFDPAGESISVEDPYQYDIEAFEETHNVLYRSLIYFIEYLKDEYAL